MRIVLALFFFGTANSASLFTSHLADAEIEYGYRNNRLTGINIEYEQGSFVQPEQVAQNIIPDTYAAQTFYTVDDGRLEQIEPTHFTYSVGFGDPISADQIAPVSAPVVQTYASQTAPAQPVSSIDMTYYKVDDSQLEQVNPTHVSYSHNAPSPAISVGSYAAPAASVPAIDPFGMTYYNVDDGQLEQVNPTHISYMAPDAPAVQTLAAPAVPAVQAYASPVVETMDATYYNVDDGQLEQVNPTHISYSVSNSAPAAETYSAPAAPAPVSDPFDMTYYKVDDGQLEQVTPTHMTYSAPDPVPTVDTYAVPANTASVTGPIPATEPVDTTYYKVDDGQFEQVKPTHVSYSESTLASTTKNTASVPRVRTSSRGRVQQTLSTAPTTQYMPVETLLGPTVALTQDSAPLTHDIYISSSQAVKEEVVVAPVVKSIEPEPYLVTGPVAEYAIPFGVDIPGVDFTSDGFSKPASAPVESASLPEVASYSIAPIADPVIETYYKIDDGQLEHVNPTHVSYASTNSVSAPRTTSRGRLHTKLDHAPVVETYAVPPVASAVDTSPATSVSETFYKVDDGQLEQVNPTHVSYNAKISVSVNEPTPAVDKYSVPALLSVPEPTPSVSLLESFYKVDDGQLEQVNPTHVSYSTHMSIPVHASAPAPAVATYAAPTIQQVPIPPPMPAAPLVETFYTVDDNQLEQVNPTHISYSTHTSVPASVTYSAEPLVFSPVPEVAGKFDSNPNHAITNMLQTFYKQDDGKLEQVTPTHVSYSNSAPLASPLPTPVVKADFEVAAPSPWWTPDVKAVTAAPVPIIKAATQAPLWNPEPVVKVVSPAPLPTVKAATSDSWWTPEPVVKNIETFNAEVTHDNSVLAITNMLQTFYKQDDDKLEKVFPTHVSYNAPATPEVATVPFPAVPTPAVEKYSLSELLSVANPTHVTAIKIATPSPWWTPDVKAATPAPVPAVKIATASPWWTPDVKAATPAPIPAVKIATPSPWWNPDDKAATPAPVPAVKIATASPWWTPDVKAATPAPVPAVKIATASPWWTPEDLEPWWSPEDLEKRDEVSVVPSLPIIKSMDKSSTKETDKAVKIEVDTKQADEEPSPTEEEGVEVNPAESKTTEEAENETVGSENAEGSERTEDSEVEEGSERAEGAEGSEGAEEEESANTKSEGEEKSGDEAETKSEDGEEEEVSKYTADSSEEEEDSDEK